MVATGQQKVTKGNTLADDLRRQVQYEINGLRLNAAERFAINVKFGLEDHTLTTAELQAIALEEAA